MVEQTGVAADPLSSAAPSTREAVRGHGPVDVLVNNAGIGGTTPPELTPESEHRQMFEPNCFEAVRCIREVLPTRREQERGAIVDSTSMEGRMAVLNQIPCSASEGALEAPAGPHGRTSELGSDRAVCASREPSGRLRASRSAES